MRYVCAAEAARLLREGKVGLIPTETVVGLVAGKAGLSKLYESKGRDQDKPIALLCGWAREAFALTHEAPPLARFLASRFWPGPLTLVLDAKDGGTVGVRVPDHAVCRAVLGEYGGPHYATSANPSGEHPPRALEDVSPAILAVADFAVKGEPGSGEASAVVDLSGDRTRLLRSTKRLGEKELFG